MGVFDRLPFTLRTLFGRRRAESELDAEMGFHLDHLIEQKRATGLSVDDARSAAMREMGSIGLYKEECRDSLGIRLLSDVRQDILYGLRMLGRSRGFSAVAILSLALGIGANTAIFTLIDSVVLRPLPVKNAGELVQVVLAQPKHPQTAFSYPIFEMLSKRTDIFSDVFVQRNRRLAVGIGGNAEPVDGAFVSGTFFKALGVLPLLGRAVNAADDSESGGPDGPVAVISYKYWLSAFGGDPQVLGRTITANSVPLKIVGVLPANFTGVFVGSDPAFFLPLLQEPLVDKNQSMLHMKAAWWLNIMAVRRPGVPDVTTRAALRTIWPGIQREAFPPPVGSGNQEIYKWTPDISDASRGISWVRNDFTNPLYYLMGIAGLVLLIACANIASLLMARTKARQHEIAVRLALGADRFRLVRQLLTESMILSVAGAALGVAIAIPGSRFLVSLISTDSSPVWLDVHPDLRILGFTIALALLTGLLFGGAPALRATSTAPSASLKENTRTGSSNGVFGKTLVVSQVSLSLLLLIAAGLFARTFWNLTKQDMGFDPRHLYIAAIDPRNDGITGDRLVQAYSEIYSGLKREPGVQSASLAMMVPVADCCWWEDVRSAEAKNPLESTKVFLNLVSPGYFATLSTPLVMGRDFNVSDGKGHPEVAVINEAMAQHYFPGMNPVGRHFSVDGSKEYQNVEIIGVVKSTYQRDLRTGVEYAAYFSVFQAQGGYTLAIVRTNQSAQAVSAIMRRAVHAVTPETPVHVTSYDEMVGQTAMQDRLTALLANFFGVLAVGLACIGLYGIMSYSVTRRTSEIGVRMALGAPSGGVLWLVLREAILLAGAGVAIGIPAALGCARVLSSLQTMLFGLTPNDPATIAATALLLLFVAAVAGYLPARRAGRLDPMSALRNE